MLILRPLSNKQPYVSETITVSVKRLLTKIEKQENRERCMNSTSIPCRASLRIEYLWQHI